MAPANPETPSPKPRAGVTSLSAKAKDASWLKIERAMFAPLNTRNGNPKAEKTFLKWQRQVADAAPPFRQCKSLIVRFGGIVPFSVACGLYPDDVIKFWLSEALPAKGTSLKTEYTLGLVPTTRLPRIIAWARVLGVHLSGDDIWPDFVDAGFSGMQEMMGWLSALKKSRKMTEFENRLVRQMWRGL